ncbi:MAG: hypothetical protein H0T61_12835 [Actinobacteria bacterium]|nr:hypothetical protein [Actinomycetota bacterium]
MTFRFTGASKTSPVEFAYTFDMEDALAGKATFKVAAFILGARHAILAVNEAVALPTRVHSSGAGEGGLGDRAHRQPVAVGTGTGTPVSSI